MSAHRARARESVCCPFFWKRNARPQEQIETMITPLCIRQSEGCEASWAADHIRLSNRAILSSGYDTAARQSALPLPAGMTGRIRHSLQHAGGCCVTPMQREASLSWPTPCWDPGVSGTAKSYPSKEIGGVGAVSARPSATSPAHAASAAYAVAVNCRPRALLP